MEKEEIILLNPQKEYIEAIRDFRNSFLVTGSTMQGSGTLKRYENIEDWIQWCERCANKDTIPANGCYCDTMIALRAMDQKVIGTIQIRYELDDYMKNYAGHIGYCVAPEERNKGYGTQMLKLALKQCKKAGIDHVLILCLEENEASRRVILNNGGKYESTVIEPNKKECLQRYWIDLSGEEK